MTKQQESSFVDRVKRGAILVSRFAAASVFPYIAEGADRVMKSVDERILRIERRLLRKIGTRLVLMFGCVFLVLALFFSFREYLGWSATAASLAIGVAISAVGLLLFIAEPEQ